MTATDPTVLLVEDDPLVRGFLADNLIADGFAVAGADTLREALRLLELAPPTSRSWTSGCRTARGWSSRARARRGRLASRVDPALPVLVLSGRGGRSTASAGSTAGPTITSSSRSPIRSCAAASRRCCAARAGARGRGVLRVGELEMDPASREVRLRGDARRAVPEGVRAAARAGAPSRRACSPRRSCCATSGAFARWADADAGLARLPAAPQARRAAATATWSTCGASATGWSTGRAAA